MVKFETGKYYKLSNATNENHKVLIVNITDKTVGMVNFWLDKNVSYYRLHNNYSKNYQYVQNKSKGINIKSINETNYK